MMQILSLINIIIIAFYSVAKRSYIVLCAEIHILLIITGHSIKKQLWLEMNETKKPKQIHNKKTKTNMTAQFASNRKHCLRSQVALIKVQPFCTYICTQPLATQTHTHTDAHVSVTVTHMYNIDCDFSLYDSTSIKSNRFLTINQCHLAMKSRCFVTSIPSHLCDIEMEC